MNERNSGLINGRVGCETTYHFFCWEVTIGDHTGSTTCEYTGSSTTCRVINDGGGDGIHPDEIIDAGLKGGGGGETSNQGNNSSSLCPSPLNPDVMVSCNDVTCGEGYESDGNGGCMRVDDYSGDGNLDDNDYETSDCTQDLERIPSSITLTNGSKVQVTFGIKKDRLNADNPVAQSLLNSIVFALNEASKSIIISHIHISATTNGGHGTYSNHYKKRAIDISRINNQSIYNIRNSDLVRVLQESFDRYSDIRENFGPAFHHKSGNNYNVGGHSDHLHISTNNCQ